MYENLLVARAENSYCYLVMYCYDVLCTAYAYIIVALTEHTYKCGVELRFLCLFSFTALVKLIMILLFAQKVFVLPMVFIIMSMDNVRGIVD